MPRIARLVVKGEKTVYHVMSRTALPGYVLEDTETADLMEGLDLTSVDRFRYRTRYFTDSGIMRYMQPLLTCPLLPLQKMLTDQDFVENIPVFNSNALFVLQESKHSSC